jgi:hypothetical protein
MFNLFKVKIPKDNAQEITELESWSVTWYVKTGWGNDTLRSAKSFIKDEDAKEFEKQLKESAKFINAWISVERKKN